jgi:hypothetical protein
MNPTHILPSTEVAKNLNISLYQARKYIKQLVDEGLLASDIEVLVPNSYDDNYYPPVIHRGYCLTKKATETQEYKDAWQAEIDLLKKIMGEH